MEDFMNFVFSADQFDFENLDQRIAYMSKDDIVDMVNLYYAGSSISELIEYYKLKVISPQFVKLFPPLKSEDICPYCNVNHVIKLPSKSTMYNNSQNSSCQNCGHESSSACTCFNCKTITNVKKQNRELEKRALIACYYDLSNSDLISEMELTNPDKICLATLLRGRLDEGLKIINPVSEYRD